MISIYLNEQACGVAQISEQNLINSLFRRDISIYRPKSLENLKAQLLKDINNQIEGIVCVGGDGTMNQMIQSLVGSEVPLLLIPGGTANDLARQLNISNIQDALNALKSHQVKSIDTISINGRYMATNGGLGFISSIAKEVNESRKKIPFFKRAMNVFKSNIYNTYLIKYLLTNRVEQKPYTIDCSEFKGTLKCSAILINNQSTLGGSFQIAPDTKNNDGKFNITILTHKTNSELIKCAYKLKQGIIPENDSDFIQFETSSVKINSLDSMEFLMDGEVIDFGTSLDIQCEKSSLKVYSYDEEMKDLSHAIKLDFC